MPVPLSRPAAPLFLSLLASCILTSAAAAQSGEVPLTAVRAGLKTPRVPVARAEPLVVPSPPRSLFSLPSHALPPIPVGTGGNPQPQTPPAREEEPGSPLSGTGEFTYFKNRVVRPAGASLSTSSVVEPSSVNVRDTSFQTGNWYAALSRDTGQTWSYVSPYSFFGDAPDGGFCCDQRVEYVRSHDLTVWLLQYSYSPTSQKNTYRLAVANGRDELRSGLAADWYLYDFVPADFGFPLRTWLDFPDVGYNNEFFYVSANVYDDASPANFVGAVVWRLDLDDLQANRPTVPVYLPSASMGGSSYRFATHAGDGTRMFWAALMSTTSIRIFRQETTGWPTSYSYSDRTTAPWQATFFNACAGPDGRGWLGNATGRIRGACGTASELVFAWTSDGNGGNRPLPYTRVARFRESDRTLIGEHDIYSTTDCWAYAALDSNRLGDIGGVIAIGGANRYVRTSGFLIDQYQNGWSQVVAYRMGDPTNNPPGGRFGDYFDVQRSWADERTFIGTGTFMNGGDQNANVEPHYAWFGRNDYEPVWVVLDVSSTPVAGIPIAVDVTDHFNRKDGTTNFQRTFAPYQGYQLTAPSLFTAGQTTYVFHRWVLDGVARTPGQTILAIPNVGITDDTAVAEYRARRTLTFDVSSHITIGVGLTVTPQDLNGQSNGFTVFTRQYVEGTQVTVTLPSGTVGGHPFRHWRINNTVYPDGQRTVVHTVGGGDARAVAVFHERTPGSFTVFGTACAGSNGVDLHFGNGTPEINQTVALRLAYGPVLSAALLIVGFSNTSWLGVPLPLAIPDAPGCSLHVAFDLPLAAATNALGVAITNLAIPNDLSLIGGHLYSQYLSVDPGANPLSVTLSNGLDTLVGGVR